MAFEQVIEFPVYLGSCGGSGGGLGSIFLGEGDGFGGDIEAEVAVLGLTAGEGERNGSGSCANIDDPSWRDFLEEAGGVFDEDFGFWARDEGGGAAEEGKARECGGTGEVLKGFASGAAANERAQGFEFGRREVAFKLEIKAEAGEVESVGEEEFGLKAWGGETVTGKVAGGGFENGKEFHGVGLRLEDRRSLSWFLRWSAARASTRGSSLPSMTRVRSWEVKPIR